MRRIIGNVRDDLRLIPIRYHGEWKERIMIDRVKSANHSIKIITKIDISYIIQDTNIVVMLYKIFFFLSTDD